jgi:hypothetical protein
MRPSAKNYNTMYKKRVLERDSFLPCRSIAQGDYTARRLWSFYASRHWTLNPPSGFNNPVHAHSIYCPACAKTRERFSAVLGSVAEKVVRSASCSVLTSDRRCFNLQCRDAGGESRKTSF